MKGKNHMNPHIQLKQTAPIFLIAFLIAWFGASDSACAVITEPADYFPNFNTAVGQGALLNLGEEGGAAYNTGVGLFSLYTLLDGSYNTGVGAGTLVFNTADRNTAVGSAALLGNATGEDNTASGFNALGMNIEGNWNTAVGSQALLLNTSDDNTATGFEALMNNTDGTDNTAVGSMALFNNTVAGRNTAIGFSALQSNTIGEDNTANGSSALAQNVDGAWNTAMGSQALALSTTDGNTAIGAFVLSSTTGGNYNTGIGSNSLLNNTLGSNNVGVGRDTLSSNTTGNSNTAVGYGAGFTITTGTAIVALGAFAGKGISTGYNVICIGDGVLGADVDNSTWMGNVWNVTPQSGNTAPVVVSDGGQLGVVASSERFKKDIASMKDASEVILSLRPVTFHYKSDAKETPQFGLIAEEVAKVNPALVLRDKDAKPYSVRYDAVNAMLLNEFLKEHQKVEEQHRRLQQQEATIALLQKEIEALGSGLQKVSAQLELNKPAPHTALNNP
jgi:hypothetical protein